MASTCLYALPTTSGHAPDETTDGLLRDLLPDLDQGIGNTWTVCGATSRWRMSMEEVPGDRPVLQETWRGPQEDNNPAAGPLSGPLCKEEQEEHCQSPTKQPSTGH